MEQEVECVVLEDNKTYIVIGNRVINNNNYYYLVNESDNKDFVIRKLVDDSLVGLDDENEFNSAINFLGEQNA